MSSESAPARSDPSGADPVNATDRPLSGVTGRTRVAAVIGDPVEHSRSPRILNAAFAATGVDWVFTAFAVADGHAGEAVAAVRALGIAGMSVTMPHKAAVAEHLDDLDPAAATLGAVNCIAWDGERLVGHNTDGEGLVAALHADGLDPRDRSVVVLGAGGAARAAARALVRSGAADVGIWNRTADRARAAAELVGARAIEGPAEGPELAASLASADLLVNATPVGMGASGGIPVPPSLLHPGLYVSELIYSPLVTPLMSAAAEVGARTSNGLGMLVHQAAVAFRLWTGEEPPLEPMRTAAAAG